jgi:hypothetical protein
MKDQTAMIPSNIRNGAIVAEVLITQQTIEKTTISHSANHTTIFQLSEKIRLAVSI